MAQTKKKQPQYSTEQKRVCVTNPKGMFYDNVLYEEGYVLDYVGPWPVSEEVCVEVPDSIPIGPPVTEAEKMLDPAYAAEQRRAAPPSHTTAGFLQRQRGGRTNG